MEIHALLPFVIPFLELENQHKLRNVSKQFDVIVRKHGDCLACKYNMRVQVVYYARCQPESTTTYISYIILRAKFKVNTQGAYGSFQKIYNDNWVKDSVILRGDMRLKENDQEKLVATLTHFLSSENYVNMSKYIFKCTLGTFPLLFCFLAEIGPYPELTFDLSEELEFITPYNRVTFEFFESKDYKIDYENKADYNEIMPEEKIKEFYNDMEDIRFSILQQMAHSIEKTYEKKDKLRLEEIRRDMRKQQQEFGGDLYKKENEEGKALSTKERDGEGNEECKQKQQKDGKPNTSGRENALDTIRGNKGTITEKPEGNGEAAFYPTSFHSSLKLDHYFHIVMRDEGGIEN